MYKHFKELKLAGCIVLIKIYNTMALVKVQHRIQQIFGDNHILKV